jgi:hypothetical protein
MNMASEWMNWESIGFGFRKGDRIAFHGYFEDRTYEKNGETRAVEARA